MGFGKSEDESGRISGMFGKEGNGKRRESAEHKRRGFIPGRDRTEQGTLKENPTGFRDCRS